ncbi:MAG: hypothetical protein U0736_02690 [Gemmataceae bacterium]
MRTLFLSLFLATLLAAPGAGRGAVDAPEPKGGQVPTPAAFHKWGQAETLVVADLTAVTPGPTGLSEPPLHSTRLGLTVRETLRGPVQPGATLTAFHSVRQPERPVFPQGKRCLVALTASRDGYRAGAVEEATADAVKQARLVADLPLGWTVDGRQFVSPWASLGNKAWPDGLKSAETMRCGKTGRPALIVGQGVTLTVAPVAPAKAIQYQTPDGDGDYRLTLTNATARPVTIPALFTDGKEVLWRESVVILCQGKAYPLPDARGLPATGTPVVLKPGASLSTVVQPLRLEGPEWPRGGYRIEFTFCLGEKGATQSFYYFSRHHDPIRARLTGK